MFNVTFIQNTQCIFHNILYTLEAGKIEFFMTSKDQRNKS